LETRATRLDLPDAGETTAMETTIHYHHHTTSTQTVFPYEMVENMADFMLRCTELPALSLAFFTWLNATKYSSGYILYLSSAD